jgi:hypothetical protein
VTSGRNALRPSSRREFLGGVGLSLLNAPRAAQTQPAPGIPRIGVLRPDTPANPVDRISMSAFLAGLERGDSSGYADGTRASLREAVEAGSSHPRPGR